MEDKLLNVKDMAKISGLSKMYFYCRKKNPKFDLQLILLGNRIRCKESDFEKWLETKKENKLG